VGLNWIVFALPSALIIIFTCGKKPMTEGEQEKGMRPIWYFVGRLLFIIDLLVIIAGGLNLYFPPPSTSVVGTTHPDLWWGQSSRCLG
jgi:hypothetical protein